MDEELRLSDLDGAFAVLRAYVKTETMALDPSFADAVYGESRNEFNDAVELLQYTSNQPGALFRFGVLGEGVDTERTDDVRYRRRRYRYLIPAAQWATDGDGEDAYFNRIELIENRWNARRSATVTVDGVEIEFECMGTEEAEPVAVSRPGEPYRVGHTSSRRLSFEVTACAN